MPQVVEEYQSSKAYDAGNTSLMNNASTSIAAANPKRLALYVSNDTPNTFCWLTYGDYTASKHQGVAVAPGTVHKETLFTGEIAAFGGFNPMLITDISIGYISVADEGNGGGSDFRTTITTDVPHSLHMRAELWNSPSQSTPQLVNILGTGFDMFDWNQTPILYIPEDNQIRIDVKSTSVVSNIDNENGTFTITTGGPTGLQAGNIFYPVDEEGDSYNVVSVLSDTSFITDYTNPGSPGIIPAQPVTIGFLQNALEFPIGVVEI